MGKLFIIIMLMLTLCSCSDNFEHGSSANQNGEHETPFGEELPAKKTLSDAEIEKHFSTEGVVITGAKKYDSVLGTETEIFVFAERDSEFLTGSGYRTGPHSVIVKNSKGQHYVVRNFEDFCDFDAGITRLFGDFYCFAAGKELCFFDAEKGAKLDFSLDFQEPENDYYAFCSVAYDEETETYALIYAPDYGTDEAKIAFQRFDAEGNYMDTAETDIPLNLLNSVPSCTPNSYANGKFQFFRMGTESWFCYDFESGEYVSKEADRAFILGGTAVLQYLDGNGINDFTYTLFENGKEVSRLSLYEPNDFHTNGDGKTLLDVQILDTEAKTLELCFGRAIHKIDFKNKTAELSYDFSGLNENDIIAKSPEGKYEIYKIGTSGRADEFSTLAVKDSESEEFRFLGEYALWEVFAFADEHTIIYDTGFNRIESIDLVSGESKVVQDFGIAEYIGFFERDNICLEYAVDAENRLILAAFSEVISAGDNGNLLAEPDDEMKEYYGGDGELFYAAGHIFFEIYDFEGKYLYTVETEVYPDNYRGPFMEELTLDGSGNASFDCDGGEIETVKYLAR